MKNQTQLIPATLVDYPTIQNMARFYVYETSRECGLNSADWACPADGLYESFDFKHYFVDSDRLAYLVKVDEELAGFILLYQTGEQPNIQWHIGEFFILARFQNRGVGRMVAQQVWQRHPGLWEVTVIPEKQRALQFWRKAVASIMQKNFTEELKLKTGRVDSDQPNRIFLTFDTSFKKSLVSTQPVTIRTATLKDAESIAKIHVKAWQESYKGIISQTYLDEMPLQDRLDLRKRILSEHNPDSIHLVATINDQIVGFCDAGPAFTESNLFHGEIYAVYLLNEYKHSGIGSTLITSAHTHLTQKKLLPYIAWVLKKIYQHADSMKNMADIGLMKN